ncbi:MFS transporter [Photorhabdus asymbiotica]|uniref:MFS transporter n=1 Tax=Photorhabdus asymbiotica TaxID=291112 RepID=UPI003DA7176C
MQASFKTPKSYIISMILGSSLVGLAMGYTLPMVSLKLASQEHNPAMLGIMSALPAIGMFISSTLMPVFIRTWSLNKLLVISLFLLAASCLFSSYFNQLFYLALPRSLMGFACGVIIVIGESWLSSNICDKYRGTLMGLYTSAFTGCQLIGPLLISVFGVKSLIPSALLSFLVVFCIILILINPSSLLSQQTEEKTKLPILSLVMSIPCLAVGVFCFSFFDATALSMLPLYGISNGIPEQVTITLVTLLFCGDALFQMPLGWFADRVGLKRVHVICGTVFVISLLLLPLTINTILLWINVVILGAFGGGIYTLSLVRVGKKYSGQALVAVNSLFGVVWGVGSLLGPLMTGTAMTIFGKDGFIIMLISIGLLFIVSHLIPKKVVSLA